MNDKKYYKLGLNIRGLRKAYGMSQLKLANELGISDKAISCYELGERIPERDILLNLAKIVVVKLFCNTLTYFFAYRVYGS